MNSKEEQSSFLDCLLDFGELLADSGAEISRVEDTLRRMGRAYGAERTEVFVITSLISITIEFPHSEAVTETRRLLSNSSTDFYRLENLNRLSRECCQSPLPLAELRLRIHRISSGKKPFGVILGGSILAGGSFAVFFGGTLADGIAGAVVAAFICFLQYRLGKTRINTPAANLLISLLSGLLVGIIVTVLPFLHMDKILIGDIMLMIPGLAITNAIRNMLVGDTISGAVRLAESLIWAAAVAGGFMISFLILDIVR